MARFTPTKLFTLEKLEQSWKEVESKLKDAPFRDVIDYRDYHFFIKSKVKRLRYDLIEIKYRPTPSVRVRSHRSKGMNRVLTYFHPADLIVYNLLCQLIYRSSKHHYFKNAFFSRARHSKETVIKTVGEFFYEPYGGTFKEWKKFSKHRAQLGDRGDLKFAVLADITNFFELIHHATVRDTVFPYVRNRELVNLLLMFLEDNILRPKYSSHLRLGLPQDSFDCSRVIANLMLLKIDRYLQRRTKGQWNRWMDDITLCVNEEVDAQRIIRDIWEMLREDGLSLNAGKTKIMTRSDLKCHLLIVENALIDTLQQDIADGHIVGARKSLKSLWRKLKRDRDAMYWEKVVERIFGLAARIQDPFLLKEISPLLKTNPKLYSAMCGYLESIPFNKQIIAVYEDYIGSGYDLYEEVQVGLLETLVNLAIPKSERTRVTNLAWRVFSGERFAKQEYSRASAILVLFTFGGKRTFFGLLRRYKSSEANNFSEITRRYLAAVLLAGAPEFHNEVLKLGADETSDLLKDLFLFSHHSKIRTEWDPKTKAAFRPNRIGYKDDSVIGVRKAILLGILTHHPDKTLRNGLLDTALKELKDIGVEKPRKHLRADEIIFELEQTRRMS